MKNIFFIFLITFSTTCFSQDISLFNFEGDAVAYIDTEEDDLTIYLFEFISTGNNGFSLKVMRSLSSFLSKNDIIKIINIKRTKNGLRYFINSFKINKDFYYIFYVILESQNYHYFY